jgi:hypothetical protein
VQPEGRMIAAHQYKAAHARGPERGAHYNPPGCGDRCGMSAPSVLYSRQPVRLIFYSHPRRSRANAAGVCNSNPFSRTACISQCIRTSVNPVNSGGAGFGWTPGGPGSRFGPQGASHSSSHRPSVLIRDVRDHIVCIMNMSTESTSQSTSHCSNWWAHERPHQRVSGRACGPPRQRARNRARRRTCGRVCEQVHAERVDKRAAKRVTQARAGHVDRRVPSASTGVRPSEWTEVRPSTWTSALKSARLSA